MNISQIDTRDCEGCLWNLEQYKPYELYIYYNKWRDRTCVRPFFQEPEYHERFTTLLRAKLVEDSASRA